MEECSVQEENNFYEEYKELLEEKHEVLNKMAKLKNKYYTIEINGLVLGKLAEALEKEKIGMNMLGYDKYDPFGLYTEKENIYDLFKCVEMILEKAKIKEV